MTKKPIIGINGDYRPGRHDAPALSWFNTGYYDCVTASKIKTAGNNKARNCPGGLPVLLPPLVEDEDIDMAIDLLDGLVLGGCHLDLDCERLGMDPHPAVRAMPPRREDFDRRLCEKAIAQRLPILAIGSGMQLLNVLCGGTLLRHLPEDRPQGLTHRDPVEPNLRHLIEIDEDSLMFDVYGPGEIRVNSTHHMAIDTLAPCFRPSARTVDGVIEAYETIDDDWFVIGVQWHPESDTSTRLDMQVFEVFAQACDDLRRGQSFILPFPKAQRTAA